MQPSALALLLDDFKEQQNRSVGNAIGGNETMFSPNEISELELIFKDRAVEALDSEDALEQCCGPHFWITLAQIDPEFTVDKKKSVVTDDISLIRILDYCVSRGIAEMRRIIKTRTVHKDIMAEFIDVDEAYRRIKRFSTSNEFF